jgi:hypothetical protein
VSELLGREVVAEEQGFTIERMYNIAFGNWKRNGDQTPGFTEHCTWKLHCPDGVTHSHNIFSGCRYSSYLETPQSRSSPWRCRLQFPLKCPQINARRHVHTSKKTTFSLTTDMRTANIVNSVTFQRH